MHFTIERCIRRKCWIIYDHRKQKSMDEPVAIMTFSDYMMNRYLASLCIMNGAINEYKEDKCATPKD